MCHAAMRGGWDPGGVHLVAVSKTVDAQVVAEAVDAGLRVFGESKVQEAAKKSERLCPNQFHRLSRLFERLWKKPLPSCRLIFGIAGLF